MKRTLITRALAAFVLLLAVCAGANAGGKTDNNAGLSLMDAIEQTAEKITGDLPAGSRVAIVAFESANDNISDYIMEELTGALFDRKIEVADRQNLEYVYKELNLQMSGNVSDESAKSVGKFLAADMVITGQLLDLDGMYRYRTSAINVETAVRASVTRLDVRSDNAARRMMAALANQKTTVKTAKYGASGDSTPQTAGTFLDRGITLKREGKYEEAVTNFNEAIRLNPNMAAAYFHRGNALYNIGEYEKALADLDEAIRLDPNMSMAYFGRALIYGDKKDYAKAIAEVTQAIRLDTMPMFYDNRAQWYRDIGDYANAVADFTHVIKLIPPDLESFEGFAVFYVGRGDSYVRLREYDRAIDDYSRAIKLNPIGEVYYFRGLLYLNMKEDYDKAIADFEAALKIGLSDTNIRLANINSALAGAYTKRALAYRIKGDLNREIADWESVLRINPNDADAKRDIEEAKRKRGR